MKFSAIPLAQTLVGLFRAKEIQHVVICPGSRNAPLTIGFTEDDYFRIYSIVDERSAGFFALGIAQQTGKPVAVVCTSGSAVVNFYPAVTEAFYSRIPLLVVSADRPGIFIDIGDGQTIRQEGIFSNHIFYSANLKEQPDQQWYNEMEINTAVNKAIELSGPVHINVPFEEPLYVKTDKILVNPQNLPPQPFVSKPVEDRQEFFSLWNTAKRILVLVGVMNPDTLEKKYIDYLANHPAVLVMTETTSNLQNEKFITAIDQLIDALEHKQFLELQPDLLLTFGGMIVSKKVKAFLRKYQPKIHWHIGPYQAYDTFFCLSRHFKMKENDFMQEIFSQPPTTSDYQSNWLQVKNCREEKHRHFCREVSYSDFKVFDKIFRTMPESYVLHLANSATVRYSQLFPIKPGTAVYCNRGTSGIEGSTSTAVGSAMTTRKKTLLITGDLSFLYDSNALWNAYIPENFKIIIVNNGGGGIFRILPGEKDTPNFDMYFETVHTYTAEHLATMYGFLYLYIKKEKDIEAVLSEFWEDTNRPKILEIFTPRTQNDEVLKNYFMALK